MRTRTALLLSGCLLALPALAQTSSTISNLPSASMPLSGTEVFPVVQSGATKKVSASNLLPLSGVTAGTYGDSTHCASFTVGANGLITSASQDTSCPGSAGVTSVFGRTGDVVATQDDYAFSQLSSIPTTVSGYGITDAATLTGPQTLTNKTLTAPTMTAPVLGTIASGNGAALTNLNPANLSTFVSTAKGGLGADNSAATGVPLFASGTVTVTGTTGSGNIVRAISPTLVTPALGTPASGNASNMTNIPVAQATGVLPAANGGAGTISGILKANGSGTVSAATSGTDFASPGVVSIVTTSQAPNAAAFLSCKHYIANASSLTFTVDATSGLSANGCIEIETLSNSSTLTANAADTITFAGSTGSAGGSVTLAANTLYRVNTDGAGKLIVSGRSAQGIGTKVATATGSFTSGNAVVTDANGTLIDGGVTPGGGSGGAQNSYVAGSYLWAELSGAQLNGSGSAPGADTLSVQPFLVSQTITISDLGFHVTTAQASSACRISIYANSTSWIGPTGSALMSTGDVATTTATQITGAVTGTTQLSPGLYWSGAMCNNASVILKAVAGSSPAAGAVVGANSLSVLSANSSIHGAKYTVAQTYASGNPTISAAPTYAANNNSAPAIIMKIASVP